MTLVYFHLDLDSNLAVQAKLALAMVLVGNKPGAASAVDHSRASGDNSAAATVVGAGLVRCCR